jgi:hypothetical protein
MLNFNYTLDSELTAPVGQLPSGIQVQAFGLALTRMSQRLRVALEMLNTPVRGLKVGPIAGIQPVWRQRLKSEIAFMRKLPDRLIATAESVASFGISNAVDQGRLDSQWNRWSEQALQVYGETLAAFQNEVSAALLNKPIQGIPASMLKIASIARLPPPSLPDANGTLGGIGVDDPYYLSGMGQAGTPLLFGALAGASLVGLAAWYFTRGVPGADRYAMLPPPPAMGYY